MTFTTRPTRSSTSSYRFAPVVKEELDVGKRQTERRYRVRIYTIERPVEQDIRLRDERVVVERRPAAGAPKAAGEAFQEREFDVVERHEEPLVAKRTGATEEVVIHKDVGERRETVRDTVRETKVDVDQGAGSGQTRVDADLAAAGDKPSNPARRNNKL